MLISAHRRRPKAEANAITCWCAKPITHAARPLLHWLHARRCPSSRASHLPEGVQYISRSSDPSRRARSARRACSTAIVTWRCQVVKSAVFRTNPRKHAGFGAIRSSRGRDYSRRPLTPPDVRIRIRRFIEHTGVVASYQAATPDLNDQRRTSGKPGSCGSRHCSTTAHAD